MLQKEAGGRKKHISRVIPKAEMGAHTAHGLQEAPLELQPPKRGHFILSV